MPLAQLDQLPQQELRTSTHWSKVGTFRGPLLSNVVNLIKPTNPKFLNVDTWDNFKVRIPFEDLAGYKVLMATHLNGKRLKLDDLGPLFIVYPYDQRKELHRPSGLMKFAWQVCRIDIE